MRKNRICFSVQKSCLAVAFLVLWISSAFAQVSQVTLPSLKTVLEHPYDLAVSLDGRLAISDPGSNKVLIVSTDNSLLTTLTIPTPTAVAFSKDGHLYIGSNSDFSVRVLDRDYRIIGWLGNGANEFLQPRNITIDQLTGDIYVVDQAAQEIKIYSSGTAYQRTISDYPDLPQDCAIIDNELYVLDQPLMRLKEGTDPIRGARVKIYDLNSPERTRNFGSYGTAEGQLFGPRSITADKRGYLYITDSFHGVVLCFDTNGHYITALQNPDTPMKTPVAAGIDADGKLFIASSLSSQINVFQLSGTPADLQIPVIDLQINGVDGPVALCPTNNAVLSVAIDPGEWRNEYADLLLAFQGAGGFYWYSQGTWHSSVTTRVFTSGKLHSFAAYTTISLPEFLAPGTYTFHLGLDTTMNDDPEFRTIFRDQLNVTLDGTTQCR